jgi:tetratricopeptide (TPR) repeat protein
MPKEYKHTDMSDYKMIKKTTELHGEDGICNQKLRETPRTPWLFFFGIIRCFSLISLLALLSLGASFPLVYAQNARPYWFTLERGKNYFRSGEYGKALLAFEDARNQRQNQYARMEQDMINLLSIPEVRRMGDKLDFVERYVADKQMAGAARVLEEVYYRAGRESLDNSVNKLLDALKQLKNYPEAEYWIGETYRAEGELGIALRQYRKAYEQGEHQAEPGFGTELLYRIADIHRVRQEYNDMEARLLEILKEDTLWEQTGDNFVRAAMTRTLENPGETDRINRFLTLYRYNNPKTLRAHELLGYYYYASSRYVHAAEHLMFVFLIQNSIFIDEIIRRRFDYTFTTLDDLLNEVTAQPSLAAYFEETDYYKTMYYLGTAFFGNGKPAPARDFWTFLSRRADADEWRNRAVAQLRGQYLERAIEMP